MNPRPALLLLLATALPPLAGAQDETERIWVKGEVNGNPVRFAFDTGSPPSMLTRQTAQQLGLQLLPPQTNTYFYVSGGKQQYFDITKECTLKVPGIEGPMVFGIADVPPWGYADFEGVLGWLTVTNCVVSIDAMSGAVSFLDKVPPRVSKWSHTSAVSIYDGLALKIPHRNGTIGLLLVDTGTDKGVALPPQTWLKWKETHPNAPLTLGTEATPSDGFYMYEEAWADSISFGPITLKNVPIKNAGPSSHERLGKEYEGTIGLASLKQLELVVDPRHDVAYWRLRKSTYSTYSYNRLGAVFCATTNQLDKGVARVIKGSPAYAAGVRDGDVLLEVDGIKTTDWSSSWISRFNLPAGTKLKLTLDRKGKVFQTTATLTDILQPNHNAAN